VNHVDYYRGISLQNFISKINRLWCIICSDIFLLSDQMYSKISENQAGFKSGYSSYAFVLKAIVNHSQSKKKGIIIRNYSCINLYKYICL